MSAASARRGGPGSERSAPQRTDEIETGLAPEVLPSPASTRPAATFEDVPSRLRTLRRIYGLSQRELARRTGLANGTISLIEQGQVSPSVASLKRLLQGFPLSLAEFFTFDLEREVRCFFRAEELPEIAGGKLSYRLVGGDRPERRLQLLHERYEAQSDTGAEMLSHQGEEAGVIVRGRIELTVGSQTRVLSAGDAYYFDSRLPHRFRNMDAETCELVSVCTPPSF
ncbi:MAG: cupin domain-containing protein [Myxococcales bacterium]|jgi:transcriptional regulator with XRE-family HTH domain|nr:MAG: cupin domain-containing protein [Myxococcales bacterium]